MTTKIKLKWAVDPEPTGRYRSFLLRAFPSAYYENGELAGCLYSPLNYTSASRTATGLVLTVRVAVWAVTEDGPRFEWKQLRVRASTIDEGKKYLLDFLNKNTQFAHPDYR